MKVICTVENLREAILATERYTGRHITLPILSHIYIKVTDKKISLSATNLETGIEYFIPGKIQKPGIITTPSKLISQLIQPITDETITLEAHQNQLTLHNQSSEINILGISEK